MASSRATLVATCLALLGGTGLPAQAKNKRPAADRDNAASLYVLAAKEFAECSTTPLPVVRGTPFGSNPGDLKKYQVAVDRRVSESVLARALFAQAAQRPDCQFSIKLFTDGSGFPDKILELAQCIEGHAHKTVKDQPVHAAAAACDLLRYQHHFRVGWRHAGWKSTVTMPGLRMQTRSLQLLHQAIVELSKRSGWREQSHRLHMELDAYEQRPFPVAEVAAMARSKVGPFIARYRVRMAGEDVVTAAKLDEKALQQRVGAVVAKLVDPAGLTLREWLLAIPKRRIAVTEDEGSSVHTDSLAFEVLGGVYHLKLLHEADGWARKCRDALAPRAAK